MDNRSTDSLVADGVRWSRPQASCHSPGYNNCVHCRGSYVSPMARKESTEKRKMSWP